MLLPFGTFSHFNVHVSWYKNIEQQALNYFGALVKCLNNTATPIFLHFIIIHDLEQIIA